MNIRRSQYIGDPSPVERRLSCAEIEITCQTAPFRVGVLSDTHGIISNSVQRTLTDCDVIVHAGDICGQNVLDVLQNICQTVIAVAGNNDAYFNYAVDQLPDVYHVRFPSGTLTVLHGHQFGMSRPDHHAMTEAFSESTAIAYGHSHIQVHDDTLSPFLVNPGAAGATRTNGGASCAVVTIEGADWNVSLHRP